MSMELIRTYLLYSVLLASLGLLQVGCDSDFVKAPRLNSGPSDGGDSGAPDSPPETPYPNMFTSLVSAGPAATTGRISCGITHISQLICWGTPIIAGANPLGNPDADQDSLVPVLGGDQGGEFLSGVKQVEVGRAHVCALTQDGAVYCWGAGKGVGNGLSTHQALPTRVVAGEQSTTETYLSDIVQVDVGFDYSCALSGAGEVYCWGDTNYLGADRTTISYSPVRVLREDSGGTPFPLTDVTSISAGYRGACAITSNHIPYCWGENATLGIDVVSGVSRVAVRPLGGDQGGAHLEDIKKIAAGWYCGCALTNSNEVYCWSYWDGGNSANPRLGVPHPRKVDIAEPVVDIAGGTYFSAITQKKVYHLITHLEDFQVIEIDSSIADADVEFESITGPYQSFWIYDKKGKSYFFGQSYFKTFRSPDGTYLEGEYWNALHLMEYLYE